MKTTRVFSELLKGYQSGARYLDSCGGTRSGKTFAALQLLILLAMYDREPRITSVVSESFPHLKRGAIRDFKEILEAEGLFDRNNWNESDKVYTFPSGSIVEFFSADSPNKVHGPKRHRLFINEAQNIPYDTARQLFIRTEGAIFIDYNPVSEFWVHHRIQGSGREYSIHSTYRDNPYLSPEQVAEIEANRGESNWWQVYGEGKIGTLEGLIYDFDTVDALPPKDSGTPQAEKSGEELYADGLDEIQGLDFGFTNDPTARVQIYVDRKRKEVYLRERCYRTRMLNRDIIDDLRADGVGGYTEIYADCAEPKSIAEIQDAGYTVIPCDKSAPVGSDRMKFQIQWVQGWRFHVTKDSLNLINELRNYVWDKDRRTGEPSNRPIDKYNHLLDAVRYALWTKYGTDAGYGQYCIRPGGRRDRDRYGDD